MQSLEADPEDLLKSQLTDNALFAFMKIIVDIENSNASGVLAAYAHHAKLKERFPDGFKVRMGFGLHYGWAIEGAGSTQSCHVCVCVRMCLCVGVAWVYVSEFCFLVACVSECLRE